MRTMVLHPGWAEAGAAPVARRRAFLASTLLVLMAAAGCGGGAGSGAAVSAMTAQPVGYGRTVIWTVSGLNLDTGLSLSISTGSCDGVAELGSGSSTQRLFSCRVSGLGRLVGEVHDSGGKRLSSLAVDIPVPVVRLTLAQGTVDLQLDPVAAPITVNNFLDYVGIGFYDNTLMHRVIAGFVVQGGGYTPGAAAGLLPTPKSAGRPPIALESNRGLSNVRGSLAMARTATSASATSQFYVNVVDNLFLDYQSEQQPGYAVFGRVIAGLDVVDAIAAVPTQTVPALGLSDVPVSNVVVQSARQIR